MYRYPETTEWDIINEPLERLFNNPQDRKAVFDSENDEDVTFLAEFIIKAKEINPSARLYVTEDDLLNDKQTNKFIDFIKRLRTKGAKIDGLGIQGHFMPRNKLSLVSIKENLDKLANLGLPLKITELDLSD